MTALPRHVRPLRALDARLHGDPTGSAPAFREPPRPGADPRNPHGTDHVAALIAMINSGLPLDTGGISTAEDGHVRHWKPRGAPCAWCGETVPEESRYASYCTDRCRCRAARAEGRRAR